MEPTWIPQLQHAPRTSLAWGEGTAIVAHCAHECQTNLKRRRVPVRQLLGQRGEGLYLD